MKTLLTSKRSVALLFLISAFSLSANAQAPTSKPTEDAAKTMISAMSSTDARERAEKLWQIDDERGFHAAVAMGLTDLVRQRLAARPALRDVLVDSTSPLAVAIANDQREVIEILLDAKADLNAGWIRRQPLFVACQFGRSWALDRILQAGVSLPKEPERVGWLLSSAVSRWDAPRDSKGTLKRLFDANAVQLAGKHAGDCLFNAARDPAVLRLAITQINDRAMLSRTLYTVAAHGQRESAIVLIDAGAEVNRPHQNRVGGYTPLHLAALDGRNDMIHLLVSRGGDIKLKTEDGDTPLDLARKLQRDSTVYLLESLERNKKEN